MNKPSASLSRASISLAKLDHSLGAMAAKELVGRIEKAQRVGVVILGRSIREACASFARNQKEGNVQVVISGRSGKRPNSALFILRIADLEAVVKAAQHNLD
jgi:DNA-binding transcriptional regulator LsrR (DeoR family)